MNNYDSIVAARRTAGCLGHLKPVMVSTLRRVGWCVGVCVTTGRD